MADNPMFIKADKWLRSRCKYLIEHKEDDVDQVTVSIKVDDPNANEATLRYRFEMPANDPVKRESAILEICERVQVFVEDFAGTLDSPATGKGLKPATTESGSV
jgi:hypothetical protein